MPALEKSAAAARSGSRAEPRASTYAKLAPSPALAPFVRHIRLVPPSEHEGNYVRLPDGQMELVLRSGGGSDADWLNVVGTRSAALRKDSGPSTAFCVVVRFKAGGGYPFFGVPVHTLTDQMVSIDELWGSMSEALRAALGDADEPRACLAATEESLRARLSGSALYEPATAAGVRHALRLLEREPVVPEVEALAEQLGASTRQLRRAFADVVGLSPKQYLRIVRFQRAQRMAARSPAPAWSAIASAVGYFDQAHMINDFRVLCGQTPKELWAAGGAGRKKPP